MHKLPRFVNETTFVLWLATAPWLYAQKEQSLCEVTVRGVRPERFMVGQKVQEIDSVQLSRFRYSTLADFLQFQSSAAFKSYGAGQATSIAFRGTSANHTAVLWNGININFPSLGQTDFSTIPLAGFDQMSVQYGSAASCVGTDAVGGSIQLRSVPDFKQKGIQTLMAFRIESSQNYTGQAGVRFHQTLGKHWNLSGKTLLYGSIFNNDFGTAPRSTRKSERYSFEPARTAQKGVVQDLYWQHQKGNLISLNLWLTDNTLTLQPKQVPLREITRTQAYRVLGSYQLGKTLIRTGFLRDIIDYGKGENLNPSHTEIDRFILRTEHDFSWIQSCDQGTNLKIGAELVHYNARVDGYGDEVKRENRADFYALLRHQFNGRLSASLNLRQALVTRFNPPFTPSLGAEYTLLTRLRTKLIFNGNTSLSYRVPTLNERYWVNLGNPDLRPERGFNKELGLTWKQRLSETHQFQLSATAFHNLIDDWTYWNPERNYRVENIQQVLTKGLEMAASIKILRHKTQWEANLNYGLTNASQQKIYGAYTQDFIGKQLIYVPRHTFGGTLTATRGKASLTVQQQFNSERYSTFDHSGRPFAPYYLLNAVLNYQWQKGRFRSDVSLQGNNLTHTVYPNLKKNAMPLRTVSINVILYFQSKQLPNES
ncbi:TonB-dependent receptor plug domain-containing protein [Runella slithyformis]|uniref:TonB-dependent receptor n=1 Tax=Runella slithyformis (strain ATCC 29530 / DSM 19594 / LMG 11500 / NCIMB 11436 / LSU 4) TaxID=761193 RepID=A0A7U3ZPI4_RUNSL|nr:TonB-dependent receptor [Runella slithyformis]AEI50989.1 TonB-dependent receptor [Runella slithyformis DSM 19594]